MQKMRSHGRISKGPKPVLGVAWYSEAEWTKIKEAAADRDTFFDTYAEWLEMAQRETGKMRRANLDVMKVPVVAEDLLAWCLIQKFRNDIEARSTYVSYRMFEMEYAGRRRAGIC